MWKNAASAAGLMVVGAPAWAQTTVGVIRTYDAKQAAFGAVAAAPWLATLVAVVVLASLAYWALTLFKRGQKGLGAASLLGLLVLLADAAYIAVVATSSGPIDMLRFFEHIDLIARWDSITLFQVYEHAYSVLLPLCLGFMIVSVTMLASCFKLAFRRDLEKEARS
ncbi:hypothetical protein [Larsenimonas suaedae]|uniref:Uncharacterized protein n=1 Tax=Larsenimonas suaedae TaxID=1851019 RepID=A0ABU1GYD0_9GAMM|nr:hypothetical protein [Larsenimonas suaedae]MCM2973020.1 hypothetical protein [Larsenimonas suaedae]MDR5896457.1 hypothetical protein [Larsenimonas suaedae]